MLSAASSRQQLRNIGNVARHAGRGTRNPQSVRERRGRPATRERSTGRGSESGRRGTAGTAMSTANTTTTAAAAVAAVTATRGRGRGMNTAATR